MFQVERIEPEDDCNRRHRRYQRLRKNRTLLIPKVQVCRLMWFLFLVGRGHLSKRFRSFSKVSGQVLLVAFGLVLARMRQIAPGLHTLRRRTVYTSRDSSEFPRKVMGFLLESAVILMIGDIFRVSGVLRGS